MADPQNPSSNPQGVDAALSALQDQPDPVDLYSSNLEVMGEPEKEKRLAALEDERRAKGLQHEQDMIERQRQLDRMQEEGFDLQKQFLEGMPSERDIQPPTYQPLDMKDIQANVFPMLIMATIAGAGQRRHAMGALSAFGAMLQGAEEGKKEAYDAAKAKYDASIAQMHKMQDDYTRRFNIILNDHNKDMTQRLNDMKLLDMEYGKFDRQMYGEPINALNKAIEKDQMIAMNLARIEAVREDTDLRATATLKTRLQMSQATGGSSLSENGKWFVSQQAAGGYYDMLKLTASRYGQRGAAQIINNLGDYYRQNNIDPRSVPVDKKVSDMMAAAGKYATVKLQQIERLTKPIKDLESRVVELKAKLYRAGATRPELQTINAVLNQVGSQDYGELVQLMNTVGIQYRDAITMPGSNAQMSVSAQNWAHENFKPELPMDTILGILKGMNLEINKTTSALQEQLSNSREAMTNLGPRLPVPGRPNQGPVPSPNAPAGGGAPGAVIKFDAQGNMVQ